MQVTAVAAKQASGEACIVGVLSTKEGKRRAPGLAAFGQEGHPQAQWLVENKTTALGPKQVVSVPAQDRDAALVLVGLGDPAKLTQETLGTALHRALQHAASLGFTTASTTLLDDSAHEGFPLEARAQALVHGAVMGSLRFDQWKSKKPKEGKDAEDEKKAAIEHVELVHARPAGLKRTLERAVVAAEAVNESRLLANTPANVANPKWMAAEAKRLGRAHGFAVAVKGRQTLRKEGYGAMCAVAQGSDNEEQLIVMEYSPEKVTKATKTLVVVGKGVCFDSGGISLKPGPNMWDMKYDKSGACNTIALMGAVARLKPKHRVIGIAPCVENMPSGQAQRPGDIITAKDGTTIEVLNTDAEGRLILADAVTLGTTYKPHWMVDMATLTGACSVAVGETYVAVMSKDDAFARSLVDAAARSGDKAWMLPQGEEFDQANKGTYADLQNISLTNKAGTCIGGSFIAHFAKETRFAHLDIASKAWTSGTDYFAKGPTAAGLRIVLQRILDEA